MNRQALLRRLERVLPMLGSEPAERVSTVLMLGLVCLGLALRARGYLFGVNPLWWDEASWGMYLLEGKYGDANLRPIGFMSVSRAICWLFPPSEAALRALPWIAGVMTTVAAPFLAERLFSAPAARLLFVAVLALHPSAIDLSKEFKPYAVSLSLHVGVLLLTLRYVSRGRASDLAAVLIFAGLGTFFAQDLVFAYPGAFLLIGWAAYERERRHLRWIALGAVWIITALAAQYVFIWSRLAEGESSYWGNKYGVFHTATSEHAYLAWLGEKFRGWLEFPGFRRTLWGSEVASRDTIETLRTVDGLVWSLLHVAGLGLLIWRKRARELVLLLVPFATIWVFNAFGFWPMGAFRTNLFTLCYLAAIAAAAFDWSWGRLTTFIAPAVSVLLVLTPLLLFETDWHATKRAHATNGDLPATIARLRALRRGESEPRKEPLLISSNVCSQWEYYGRVHPAAAKFRRKVDDLFDVRCSKKLNLATDIRRAAAQGTRVWTLLYYKFDPQSLVRGRKGKTLEIVEKKSVRSIRIVAYKKKASTKR